MLCAVYYIQLFSFAIIAFLTPSIVASSALPCCVVIAPVLSFSYRAATAFSSSSSLYSVKLSCPSVGSMYKLCSLSSYSSLSFKSLSAGTSFKSFRAKASSMLSSVAPSFFIWASLPILYCVYRSVSLSSLQAAIRAFSSYSHLLQVLFDICKAAAMLLKLCPSALIVINCSFVSAFFIKKPPFSQNKIVKISFFLYPVRSSSPLTVPRAATLSLGGAGFYYFFFALSALFP